METLPNIEKNIDKKMQKNTVKNKNINKVNLNDFKETSEQKSAEQNL